MNSIRKNLLVLIISISFAMVAFVPLDRLSFMIPYLLTLAILRKANHLEGIIFLEEKVYYKLIVSVFLFLSLLFLFSMYYQYDNIFLMPLNKIVLTLGLGFMLLDTKPRKKKG